MLDRRGETRYWYAYARVGGRVRRIYRGAGEAADEAAREQSERHLLRETMRDEARRDEQEYGEVMTALEEFSTLLDQATRAVLTGLGFQQHARGDWRLRRDGSSENQSISARGEEHHRACDER